MNPRIASIENIIARDPGERNVFGLMVADQLRLAAQSLRLARRVAIVSGFFIPEAGAGETDGPHGAKVVGDALTKLGIPLDYLTDEWNAPLFLALGIVPLVPAATYLDDAKPTHLLAIERVGRGVDGRYRNMRGMDITATTAPLDELFIAAGDRGITTIGIGDGGNEIGMGRVFADTLTAIPGASRSATTVATDYCIAAGVSNWGAYGLTGALSVLESRDLLPTAEEAARDLERLVHQGGAVDGVTHRRECTVDGLELSESLRMLEEIRHHITPSPLIRGTPLLAGIVGYGDTGRAAAALLVDRGHQVRISDVGTEGQCATALEQCLILGRGAAVERGGHSIEFLSGCDLAVVGPGVRGDAPIRQALHRRGIPVMSELELAYQFCPHPLIAVTGTVGKRTTVELLAQLFHGAGRSISIGGNRGRPLSSLLLDQRVGDISSEDPLAIAVSSFQLETVVHFRPHIAIILNVNEAHLDRHRTIAEYVRTKSRIFMNHRANDVLILNFDDPWLRPLVRKHHGRTFFVSRSKEVEHGAWLWDGVVRLKLMEEVEEFGAIRSPFPENLLSAIITARLCGIDPTAIHSALKHSG